jgi:hypothetical protein
MLIVIAVVVSGALAGPLAAQVEMDGVTIEDLAQTLPLPVTEAPTTATLQRIVMVPGATLERDYHGPVLFYVERGTLLVDPDRHRLAIIQSGDDSGRVDRGIGRGKIPAGYGIYSVDGSPGRMQNSGDEELVMLAVLFVPQPSGAEVDSGGGAATSVPVRAASPVP